MTKYAADFGLSPRPNHLRVGIGQALQMLVHCGLRPFTEDDWMAFQGCMSSAPLIGYINDNAEEDYGYALVLDGGRLRVIHNMDDKGGQLFELTNLI